MSIKKIEALKYFFEESGLSNLKTPQPSKIVQEIAKQAFLSGWEMAERESIDELKMIMKDRNKCADRK